MLPTKLITALVLSPSNRSTSVGRKYRGSTSTRTRPVAGIDASLGDVRATPLDVDADFAKRLLDKGANGSRYARRQDIIVGLVLLQHQPHAVHEFARVAPVALRIEGYRCKACPAVRGEWPRRRGSPCGLERFLLATDFMVEQNAVRRVKAIGFAVVDHDPVRIEFGRRVGRTWIERRRLVLRNGLYLAVEFRRRCLIEARLLFQSKQSDCLEQADRSDPIGVGRIFRCLEAHLHMRLCRQIVNFRRAERRVRYG